MRFICGTFTVHRALEAGCARLVGMAASLSFVKCWNANEAVPGTLLGEDDIVISDQLNHASIIDGVRLAKAITKCQTAVYKHADLADLEARLVAAKDRRVRMVITDGVFSMESAIARLPDIAELCRRHDAVLVVDDSHATGVLGKTGRGTAEHFGMVGEVDIITSTLGKALGVPRAGSSPRPPRSAISSPSVPGRSSSPTRSPPTVAQRPRQRRVPRAPPRAGEYAAAERALLPGGTACQRLRPHPGETPIVPVILGETAKAIEMSRQLLAEGVFVTGFGFPVVPQGAGARIRCQISAAHTRDDLDGGPRAIRKVGQRLGIV